MRRKNRPKREAAAAVELAFVVLFFFIPVLFGIWEAGRLIEVQQIVSNSAREGARFAAQGYTINSSGSPTLISKDNVQDFVRQYLVAQYKADDGSIQTRFPNLQASDITVKFVNLTSGATDPYLGSKNDRFTVEVRIPWSKVQWVNWGIIQPQEVTFTATWQMLIDDKFTVNQSMPSL